MVICFYNSYTTSLSSTISLRSHSLFESAMLCLCVLVRCFVVVVAVSPVSFSLPRSCFSISCIACVLSLRIYPLSILLFDIFSYQICCLLFYMRPFTLFHYDYCGSVWSDDEIISSDLRHFQFTDGIDSVE